jgi:hypothetical protein
LSQDGPQVRPHERPPHPCQHAYTNFRARILATLTRSKSTWLSSHIQSTKLAIFLVLDVPARWLMDMGDMLVGNRGYFAIGSVVAAYFAVFGLIDAKSTQEESRASLERSLFITLVSSGNAASFVAAMKDFGAMQTMRATEHPSLFRFWDWGRAYQPNKEPLQRWAEWRLSLCNKEAKDCGNGGARIELTAADLNGTDLRNVDLCDADLSYAELNGANLTGANLNGARLFFTTLYDANLREALLVGTELRFALYSSGTRFPDGFDPEKAGMVVGVGPPAPPVGTANGLRSFDLATDDIHPPGPVRCIAIPRDLLRPW